MQSIEIERIKNRIQNLEKENEVLRAENSDLWNEINKVSLLPQWGVNLSFSEYSL